MLTQETALAQSKLLLPPLEKQLAQQRDLLTYLSGRFPSEAPSQTFAFASLELPADLPLSLPSQLVEQRPDVRAAEAEVHAAAAQIGVATADLLPQFTLDAALGTVAGGGFWSLAAGAAQPFFQGGALVHRKRAAEAAYDEAAAKYRSTVLGAFQNVADALRALELDADAFRAALEAKRLAEQNLAIARRQLELGDISYFSLITVQQAYQQSSLAVVQAQANRYADAVALLQSLGGGGWWTVESVAPDRTIR